jgi:class 3 adenylate cyclase
MTPVQFQRIMATIMFTDVEDSTGLASTLGLIETTHFLIEHVSLAQRVVHERGGIIQNFTGDGVLALWLGTLMHPRDTALRALAAAADLVPEISISNAWRRSSGLLTRRVRIGLHTGEVMFVHDRQRNFSFVVGSEVNFARRVEQAGKKENCAGADTLVMASGATLCLADLSTDLIDPRGFFRLSTGQLSAFQRR